MTAGPFPRTICIDAMNPVTLAAYLDEAEKLASWTGARNAWGALKANYLKGLRAGKVLSRPPGLGKPLDLKRMALQHRMAMGGAATPFHNMTRSAR